MIWPIHLIVIQFIHLLSGFGGHHISVKMMLKPCRVFGLFIDGQMPFPKYLVN
jgi:hypothetical protein